MNFHHPLIKGWRRTGTRLQTWTTTDETAHLASLLYIQGETTIKTFPHYCTFKVKLTIIIVYDLHLKQFKTCPNYCTFKVKHIKLIIIKGLPRRFVFEKFFFSENMGLGDPWSHLLHSHHRPSQPCHKQVTVLLLLSLCVISARKISKYECISTRKHEIIGCKFFATKFWPIVQDIEQLNRCHHACPRLHRGHLLLHWHHLQLPHQLRRQQWRSHHWWNQDPQTLLESKYSLCVASKRELKNHIKANFYTLSLALWLTSWLACQYSNRAI